MNLKPSWEYHTRAISVISKVGGVSLALIKAIIYWWESKTCIGTQYIMREGSFGLEEFCVANV